jgi:hypothetical protein
MGDADFCTDISDIQSAQATPYADAVRGPACNLSSCDRIDLADCGCVRFVIDMLFLFRNSWDAGDKYLAMQVCVYGTAMEK